MKNIISILLIVLSFNSVSAQSACQPGNTALATARSYAVLAGSAVTNTGPTTLVGDLGVSPSNSVSGYSSIIQIGTLHQADAVAAQAKVDLTTAYNSFAGLPFDTDLTGQDLGGLVLLPGVYRFASSAQLTGMLTLDTLGNPNSVFVFQIGSSLTTASSSSVNVIGGPNNNIFWQVGSSATLGTTTSFVGNILALASITLNNGASIQCGSALAQSGAVTLDTNLIGVCNSGCIIPVCGDGLLHASEACDDGNLSNNDACSAQCQIQTQDCAGVFGGSAVLDRCNVCNGNGQSCITCVETNNVANQRMLDGAGLRLRAYVFRTGREIIRRAGRTKRLTTYVNNLNTQAMNLSNESWQFAWSFPSVSHVCNNPQFCTTVSLQPFITGYNENIQKLNLLVTQAVKKLKTITPRTAFANTTLAQSRTELARINVAIAAMPTSETTCN